MKLGLLGKGKTGSFLIGVCAQKKIDLVIFDSKTPPTEASLKDLDGVISFLPGEAFVSYLPLLLASKLPVVSGSTGFEWPEGVREKIAIEKLSWLQANNFALGMAVVRLMIENMGLISKLVPEARFDLHEIHHTKKLDAPSGTALSFKKWSGVEMPITSERTGDVIGIHTMIATTSGEKITLTHEALDRKIFAEGAVWAMERMLESRPQGLIDLHQLLSSHLLGKGLSL